MNRNFGKLATGAISYAPDMIDNGVALLTMPTAEDYAAAGWLPVIDTPPAPRDGFYAVPMGWEVKDGAIVRVYEERAVEPPPRVYSVEEIIYSLGESGKLDGAKAVFGWMYDLLTMRETVSADNEIFASQYPRVRAALVEAGVFDSEAEVDAMLAEAEVGA